MLQVTNLRYLGNVDEFVESGGLYCGRPGPLGNQFIIGTHGDRDTVIALFRKHLWREINSKNSDLWKRIIAIPDGTTLGCWCKPQPCHCDVIVSAWEWHRRTGGVR